MNSDVVIDHTGFSFNTAYIYISVGAVVVTTNCTVIYYAQH